MIQYQTKSEVTLRRLKEMISTGDLKPGDRVTATEVAQKLNVSRTPVNEALKRLSDRGIVTILPNVGFRINVLPWEEIQDSMRLKLILEKTAITWIKERNISVDLEPIKKKAISAIEAITHQDHAEYHKLMRDFHISFIALANSRPLLTSFTMAWDYQSFEKAQFIELSNELLDLVMDHTKILQCIEKKDYDGALSFTDEHLKRWITLYKTYVLNVND